MSTPDRFNNGKQQHSTSKSSLGTLGQQNLPPATATPDKKKKKGIFGGLFSGKKNKGRQQQQQSSSSQQQQQDSMTRSGSQEWTIYLSRSLSQF